MIVIGLSHKSAPIQVRERLAVPAGGIEQALHQLHAIEGMSEAVVLSTCNRLEVYAAASDGIDEENLIARVARNLADRGGHEVAPHLVGRRGSDAVRHLFRVACSLDSLVVGEPQILGQLKEAIQAAVEAKTIGPELSAAMRAALTTAKRVRTDTAIGAGQVSVPTVAVDLARQIFDDLHERTALMVGAGEMAESAAKLLARAGTGVVVVNRSLERAELLAASVGGRPRGWQDLEASLLEADIVISSTASPTPVITKKQLKALRRKRRGRSLFLIDIAVPRDVDPEVNDLENVYLYDIDDLSHVVAQSLEGRAGEATKAEDMVEREAKSYEERRSQLAMKPLIVALRERTREVLHGELGRTTRSRLKHLSEEDLDALAKMLEAAANKLLHAPTTRLKQIASTPQSEDVAQLMCHLFELDAALVKPAPETATSQAGEAESSAEDEAISERRPIAVR